MGSSDWQYIRAMLSSFIFYHLDINYYYKVFTYVCFLSKHTYVLKYFKIEIFAYIHFSIFRHKNMHL